MAITRTDLINLANEQKNIRVKNGYVDGSRQLYDMLSPELIQKFHEWPPEIIVYGVEYLESYMKQCGEIITES